MELHLFPNCEQAMGRYCDVIMLQTTADMQINWAQNISLFAQMKLLFSWTCLQNIFKLPGENVPLQNQDFVTQKH